VPDKQPQADLEACATACSTPGKPGVVMESNAELVKFKGILRRRRWWLILPFAGVLATVSAVVSILPNMYRSTSTILIRNSQIPPNLVPSTVTSYADQRIKAITQEVSSRTKILKLVEKYDLLPDKRELLTTEDLVKKVYERISVETIDAEIKRETQIKPVLLTVAFTLSYVDQDPRKAQLVTGEIASYFMEKNLEAREKHARNTAQFLEEHLRQAKASVDGLESRLAVYREAHLEELPEFTSLSMQKLEKLNADIGNLNMQIRSLEEQRSAIKNRLTGLDPFSGANERVLTVDERIRQAKLERAGLVAKYSEKHPLLQTKNQEINHLQGGGRTGSEIDEARARLRELELEVTDLKARYTEKHPAIATKLAEITHLRKDLEQSPQPAAATALPASEKITNPVFLALKTDLDKTEVTIISLKAEKGRLEDAVKRVYNNLHQMPQVSKEYNELTTDYQNAKANYTELQQKSLAAQLAQGMEEEQLGEGFQIVEPAFLPEEPVKPNRLAIMLIGVVLGSGLAIGLTSLRELADGSVHDIEIVEKLSGLPIMSTIPRILTREDLDRGKRNRVAVVVSGMAGFVAASLLIHLYVMDFYVFYAKVARFFQKHLPI
jgi:polysaccharide biosynthesis transport protein